MQLAAVLVLMSPSPPSAAACLEPVWSGLCELDCFDIDRDLLSHENQAREKVVHAYM